jgi:N-acyl amino acid synthase of PEP-CTERM/exosortase system
MKKIKKYIDTPIIGPVVKRAMDFMINREVHQIAQHFSNFLSPVVASSEELKQSAFRIRHNVYCEELNFEAPNAAQQEMDNFDPYSIHCLINHSPTDNFAGTIRVVRPLEKGELLPIQKYCLDSITKGKINPSDFAPHQVCEISRLAVPKEFRRRNTDQFKGAATGAINESNYSEVELRCFPFIAVGLYLSAASIVIEKDILHTFVMMEPRLARSMSFVGIKFEQIGPTVDYHGKRAPYYINPKLLFESLSPGFKLMLSDISDSIGEQAKLIS